MLEKMDNLIWFILLSGVQHLTFAENFYVNVGNSVQLTCNTNITYPQWEGPEGFYNYAESETFNPNLVEKTNRLSWGSNTYDLVLTNVRRNDSGRYFCYTEKHLFVRVVPLVPRVMRSQGYTILWSEGTMLTLTCMSSGGFPESNIVWYKRSSSSTSDALTTTTTSVHITSSDTYNITGTHSFLPTASDDGVMFICLTFFKDGSRNEQHAEVTLIFNLKPRQPTIEQIATVTAGNNVEVRCRTTGSRPAAVIYWSYRNTNLTGSSSTELDSSTNTYTVVSILTRQVTAEDNGRSVRCMVSHLLLEPSQLAATVDLNVEFSAKTYSTTVTGNKALIATGRRALTLNCTTGSSNPASDIMWKNNSEPISNSLPYISWKGENNGQVRSQNLVLYPTRYMDGDVITCLVSNVVNAQYPISGTAILDLQYPPLIKPMSDIIATEGNNTLLTCLASSKPVSTFKWYRDGQSSILHQGIGTFDSNELSYTIYDVRRTDAGTYTCYANNGIETDVSENVLLAVHSPPEVEVITVNTSVKAKSVILTCHAEGFPDTNYEYGKWIQTWVGYDKPISENIGNETLELENLTYEHSGIYTCSASNGVKDVGTGEEFIEGSVGLLVKSFPIIVSSTRKIAARMKESASFVVIYFSNVAGTSIKIYKNMDGSKTTTVIYNVSESSVKIDLPMFTHRINTIGTKALILIQIESIKDFGVYTVVLTNEIESSVQSFEIHQKGHPNDPYIVRVESIQYNTARLSWITGYDGGFSQTFVIELSTDSMSWRNVTYDGGQNENAELQTYVLHDLQYSTKYFLRMYAFNMEGISNFSETITFNTPVSVESSKDIATLIIGVVSGLVTVGVVTYAIIATILLKRTRGKNQTKDDTNKVNQMYINLTSPEERRSNTKEKNNKSRGDIKCTDKPDSTTYTELDNQLRDKESAYEAISSM